VDDRHAAPASRAWLGDMPWRLDTATRVDDIVAAIHHLVVTGGVAAVSYRAVAGRIGLSPSTLHHHFPDRAHLLKVVAGRMSRYRLQHFADRIRGEGLAAMVPETADDVRDTVVWLAFHDLARTEPMLTLVMAEARLNERQGICSALEAVGVSMSTSIEAAEAIQLCLEGLESARARQEDPMTYERALELLEQVVVALTGAPGIRPTAAA
jgi:AcrR family transcriptional regulator